MWSGHRYPPNDVDSYLSYYSNDDDNEQLGDAEENNLVGQFDDVFDDTADLAGENNKQLPNEVGQFDGLFDTAEENVVGQFDDVFDSTYDGGNNTTIVATTAIIPHKNVSVHR